MFNVRLAGGHLYGKQLFTWLSLVVSLMASFVLSFFPLDVLDEIWDLIESVSEGFLTYSLLYSSSNGMPSYTQFRTGVSRHIIIAVSLLKAICRHHLKTRVSHYEIIKH